MISRLLHETRFFIILGNICITYVDAARAVHHLPLQDLFNCIRAVHKLLLSFAEATSRNMNPGRSAKGNGNDLDSESEHREIWRNGRRIRSSTEVAMVDCMRVSCSSCIVQVAQTAGTQALPSRQDQLI